MAVNTERLVVLRAFLHRGLAALVLGTSALLPLVFVPGLDDGYALPKTMLLWLAALVGSVGVLAFLLVGGSLRNGIRPGIELALIGFVAWFGMSTFVSTDVRQSIIGERYQYQGLLTVLIYVAAFLLAGLVLGSPLRLRALMSVHLVVGGVVAGYAIAQVLGVDPFWSGPPDERPISSVGQANNLAAYLDLVVIVGIGLWSGSARRIRTAICITIALSIIAVGLTLSRGGYLALLGGVCAVAATGWSHSIRITRRRALAAAMAMTILAVSLVALPTFREPFQRIADRVVGNPGVGDGSIRMHTDLWRVGAAMAIDRPILGTSPETFPLIFDAYLDGVLTPDRVEFIRRFRVESPHNEFIGIAAGSGIPALVAYVVFLAAVATACVRHLRRDPESGWIAGTVLGALVVHAVSTFFMTPETSTSFVFWVVLGSGLAAMTLTRTPR